MCVSVCMRKRGGFELCRWRSLSVSQLPYIMSVTVTTSSLHSTICKTILFGQERRSFGEESLGKD